jgi:low affinity Fe/Cu permease
LAITLAQMVLNGQYDREVEAHRRDVAMHAKLDELISATKRARDELIGIEELEEEQIVELKDEAKQAIDRQGARAGDPQERETAKAAVEAAAARARKKVRSKV